MLKQAVCYCILDRRFCVHLSIDGIHGSNGVRLRARGFYVPVNYISWWSPHADISIFMTNLCCECCIRNTEYYLKFSNFCFWTFLSSGMRCCVLRPLSPAVSKDLTAFVFMVKKFNEKYERPIWPRSWRHCYPPKRPEFLTQRPSVISQKNEIFSMLCWWFIERILPSHIGSFFFCLTDKLRPDDPPAVCRTSRLGEA